MANVYVIEDAIPHGELLRATLSKDPSLAITVINDGLQGYRKVQQAPPDLVVLDIILPSLPGLAVARLLKFSERYRHIPIVMMSSITDEDIRARALEAGANMFLSKPLDLATLGREVKRLLEEVAA